MSDSQHALCPISRMCGSGNIRDCTRPSSLLEGAGFLNVSLLDMILVWPCVLRGCGVCEYGDVHVVPRTALIWST